MVYSYIDRRACCGPAASCILVCANLGAALMADLVEHTAMGELKPLPYHEAMRDYLKEEETDVWHWYASNKVRDEQAEAVRFELLKSTYRVEREAQAGNLRHSGRRGPEARARRSGHHLPGAESPRAERLAGLCAGRGPHRPARSGVCQS